jgi:hypothetical protein
MSDEVLDFDDLNNSNDLEENKKSEDPRRVPTKKGGNKHNIKRGSSPAELMKSKEYKQEEVIKKQTNNNNKSIRTAIKDTKNNTPKSNYLPELNKNYYIVYDNKIIYDTNSKDTIVYNDTFILIKGKKYAYEKVIFILR